MAIRSVNCLALCAGCGGLELGVRIAVPGLRVVGIVERQAYCAATLVARMEEQAMDQAPIWDDVSTFDAAPWRGVVDLVTAGFPCQPHSVAGSRLGVRDNRWIWPAIARVIRDVAPSHVFLENVPGVARSGLVSVMEDLARMGFDAEWDVFTAAEAGAPHLRRRLFVLAVSNSAGARLEAGQAESADDETQQPPPVGMDWWAAEPAMGRVADGVAHRVDRLHAIGNGVVPQVAAIAWRELMKRFF